MIVNTYSTKNVCPDNDDESAVITDIPQELEPNLNNACWIFGVPRKLRQQNEAAYTPQLVSIGPFHHGKPKFKSMETHKTRYQQRFWERDFCEHILEGKKVNHVTEDFLEGVRDEFMKGKNRIERVRSCYAGLSELKTKDDIDHFSNVIFRDACFIFELFLRNLEGNREDYILRTPWLRFGIVLDLILLENQLPFFVLKELFDFILDYPPPLTERLTERQRLDSLKMLAIEFFRDHYRNGQALEDDELMERLDQIQNAGKGERDPFAKLPRAQAPDPVPGGRPESRMSVVLAPFVTGGGADDEERRRLLQIKRPGIRPRMDVVSVPHHVLISVPRGGVGGSDHDGDDGQAQTSKTKTDETARFATIKHFTDLVRQFMLSGPYEPPSPSRTCSCSYSAKKLDRAGVNFVPCTNRYLADIKPNHDDDGASNKYKCNIIPCTSLKVSVPKFKIGDGTECVMRNVMALEQCLHTSGAHICDYVSLLDELIDTAEDVELLIEKGILENLLGSNKAVADLVNKLHDEIVVEESSYYDGIRKKLNDHYKNKWCAAKETLKRVYFKDLWTGSATVVGFFLTLYSIINTITTVIDMFSPTQDTSGGTTAAYNILSM